MAELKKCPYCGGEAKIIEDNTIVEYPQYQIRCKNVACTIRPKTNWHVDKQEAIKHWNNRASEAELRENVIEEFAEAIMVKATELSEKVVFDGRLVGDALSLDCVSDMVVEIASNLKGEKE